MAVKKVGELIKEARTGAGLTQEKLAAAVGLVASDISKAERGELDLTDAALKKIAKATGVTQASLLNAPKGGAKAASKPTTAKTASSKTTTAAKTTTAKSTTAKSTTTKTSTAAKSTARTPANADVSMKVTSTEKKLIEYYRSASSDEKKAATKVLKGECSNLLATIIGGGTNAVADNVADLLGDVVGSLLGMKK